MEHNRQFDELTKMLVTGVSRRTVLKGLAGSFFIHLATGLVACTPAASPATPTTAAPESTATGPCDPANEPQRSYVGRSTAECARIRFTCAPGTTYFANDCGCGCEQV